LRSRVADTEFPEAAHWLHAAPGKPRPPLVAEGRGTGGTSRNRPATASIPRIAPASTLLCFKKSNRNRLRARTKVLFAPPVGPFQR
jgi:hypothetical protein